MFYSNIFANAQSLRSNAVTAVTAYPTDLSLICLNVLVRENQDSFSDYLLRNRKKSKKSEKNRNSPISHNSHELIHQPTAVVFYRERQKSPFLASLGEGLGGEGKGLGLGGDVDTASTKGKGRCPPIWLHIESSSHGFRRDRSATSSRCV